MTEEFGIKPPEPCVALRGGSACWRGRESQVGDESMVSRTAERLLSQLRPPHPEAQARSEGTLRSFVQTKQDLSSPAVRDRCPLPLSTLVIPT